MKLLNVQDPETDAIVRAIELDPAIFGSVLACANSPLFAGVSEIVDLRVAINRLGLKEIRRIIFHVVLDSAFRSDNPEINKFLRSLWNQNLAVSLTMQRLIQDCPEVGALPVDMVALAYPLGLMHVIGIPVLIINYYHEFSLFLRDDLKRPLTEIFQREHEIFDGFDHFELGAELVKRWGFPDFFPDVVGTYCQPEPELDRNARVMHSLLRHARHLTQELGYAALPAAPEGYWTEGNVIDLSGIDSEKLMADIQDQMERIRKMFS